MALMGHSIRAKNMRNLMAVLMLAAGLTAMPAHASFLTGNELAEYCSDDKGFFSGVCYGYITGVADRLDQNHHGDYGKDCTPDSVTNGQLVKVAKAYLDDNPTQLHRSAHYLIYNALIEGFGCNDGLSYPNG